MAKKKPETKVDEAIEKEVPEGYVEITPEQLVELQGGGMQTIMSIGLAERLYLEDRQDRILYLDGEVDDDVLHTLILQIAKINGEDFGKPVQERIPITLIINSGGGNAIIGMALVNTIQNSTTPVIGVCLGLCASMAFGVYAVCHTRVSVPDAVFMVHDGYESCPLTTTTKAQDWAKFSPRLAERYNKAVASRTKFTVKELTEIMPHDTWFFADDLVEMDMVDGIIGKDVEMEEIFSFMSDAIECDDEECECHKK
jgi:ATP-dependent Clp endopeptidase proteolytic subunit ClpP